MDFINNKEELVSIIIPIFNVEEYIKECMDSLQLQTYSNIEIILVDDGSTDNSPLICDEYEEKYNNIRVLHQVNKGVSQARNNGIKLSRGKYIVFVDPDDSVSPYYIESLLKALKINSSDLAISSYTNNKECLTKNLDKKSEYKVYSSRYILDNILANNVFDGFLWNKIFKKEIIIKNNLEFLQNITIWEDMYFVLKYLICVDKVVCFNEKIYFYRIRPQSASYKISFQKQLVKVQLSKKFIELENNNTIYSKCALKLYLREMIEYAFKGIKERQISKKQLIYILNEIKKYSYKDLLSRNQKIKILLLKISVLIKKA